MSVMDGTWNITVASPIGEQTSVLNVTSDGEQLSGTMVGDSGTSEITEGKIAGDTASWTSAITVPMPLSLAFSGTVDGDSISGEVTLGSFGNFPFSGTKS